MEIMFLKEAESMMRLHHPHIIRLHGIVLGTPLMLVSTAQTPTHYEVVLAVCTLSLASVIVMTQMSNIVIFFCLSPENVCDH